MLQINLMNSRIDHAQLTDKPLKCLTILRFCEDVSQLFISKNKMNFQISFLNVITYEMIPDVNVFCSGVHHRVVGDGNGTSVITKDRSSFLFNIIIHELVLHPWYLSTTSSSINVLCFSCGCRHTLLLLTSPTHQFTTKKVSTTCG